MWHRVLLSLVFLLAPARLGLTLHAEDNEVQVTVLAILANPNDDKVCPKCAPIAAEIQKKEPNLTGFRIERTTVKKVPVGKSVKFPLVGKVEVIITIESNAKDGKTSLTIEPPTLGAVTYNCKCGKFFPILTRYITPEGERLIVAVMADLCPAKAP